jgi:hypothetical protein
VCTSWPHQAAPSRRQPAHASWPASTSSRVIRRDALTPADVRALQIVENFHREDMTAIEKAEALGGLTKTHKPATNAYVTGRSSASVSRYPALLELDRNPINGPPVVPGPPEVGLWTLTVTIPTQCQSALTRM